MQPPCTISSQVTSSFKLAGHKGKSRQGKDAGQLCQGAALQNLLQTKINLFTLPNQRNFMSSLWQVIPRWFSQEAAKENVRFVGCAAGGVWVPGGSDWAGGCF